LVDDSVFQINGPFNGICPYFLPSINPEMLFWEEGCYSIGFFLGGLLVDLRHTARGELTPEIFGGVPLRPS